MTLFNGDGQDYSCELISVRKNEAVAKVKSVCQAQTESPLNVTLAQAISSGDRMDFTIQKAVEMGVTAIQPVASQRSIVKLAGERADRRREHWQNVAISACEQSGRAVIPEVFPPVPLAIWLGNAQDFATRITLSPAADQTLHDLARPEGNICLLIGCEGGFTQDEINMASSQGFISVKLGKRILRTETAGLAALAALQILWGDY